ncbi:MAG TPA: hypothetical protein VK399_05620 [Longimicrobiaceae bacterium]|nr:hypothetical protein [Longimicrobiaceae bacterium]
MRMLSSAGTGMVSMMEVELALSCFQTSARWAKSTSKQCRRQ